MHDLVAAFVLDAMDADERAEFERHLAGCEACRAEVAAGGEAAARLALAVAAPAPETLRTSVMAAIEQTPQEQVARIPAQRTYAVKRYTLRARPSSRVLALTCAVFGVAAAAFAWTTIHQHDSLTSAQNRERALAAVLAAPDVHSATQQVAGGGTLTAYYSPALGKSAIVGNGLPALAGSRTYELWYLDGPGKPARAVGTSRFDTAQHDIVLASQNLPTANLAITVEPAGGSKAPTTPPLATLGLT